MTIIRQAIRRFDPEAEIILFGSRTDPTARGGDIDLLVVSRRITPEMRRQIRVDLLLRLGDRKIDLIVTDDPDAGCSHPWPISTECGYNGCRTGP